MRQRTLQPESICEMAGRVVLRRIGEENLLVPISGDAALRNGVYPCNETSVWIWEQLKDGKSVAETAKSMTDEFEVNYAVAEEDCLETANQLVEEQLLEVVAL